MFVYQPRKEVDLAHKHQEESLNEEIGNLVKKVLFIFIPLGLGI